MKISDKSPRPKPPRLSFPLRTWLQQDNKLCLAVATASTSTALPRAGAGCQLTSLARFHFVFNTNSQKDFYGQKRGSARFMAGQVPWSIFTTAGGEGERTAGGGGTETQPRSAVSLQEPPLALQVTLRWPDSGRTWLSPGPPPCAVAGGVRVPWLRWLPSRSDTLCCQLWWPHSSGCSVPGAVGHPGLRSSLLSPCPMPGGPWSSAGDAGAAQQPGPTMKCLVGASLRDGPGRGGRHPLEKSQGRADPGKEAQIGAGALPVPGWGHPATGMDRGGFWHRIGCPGAAQPIALRCPRPGKPQVSVLAGWRCCHPPCPLGQCALSLADEEVAVSQLRAKAHHPNSKSMA